MSNGKVEVFLVLRVNLTVSKSFFDSIRQQVAEIIPALLPYAENTLQTLCGDDYWYAMPVERRRIAGQVMAYMVQHDLLPFEFSGHLCTSPKRYRLK